MSIIAKIKELGVSTSSHFEAQRNLKKVVKGTEQRDYERFVSNLTGTEFSAKSCKHAELVVNYLVIDAVKHHTDGFPLETCQEALDKAIKKANDFLVKNGWVAATSETAPFFPVPSVPGEAVQPAPASTGKKRTGPSKKDQSIELFNKVEGKNKTRKELIEIFKKELGLTDGGASTYVHNCQKGLWK